jgi:NADH-quinone oxidoreductase subunit G
MVNVKINNIPVCVEEGTTILKAAAQAGISIPTLCFLKDLNEIGACRICVVEVKGKEKLITACNNAVVEGMEIYTNSPKVRNTRKINVELILSQHDAHCVTCVRSRNCPLQNLANDLDILDRRFEQELCPDRWPKNFPLIRDVNKCIKCMRCIQVCDKIQNLHVWDVVNTGSRTNVGVSNGLTIQETDCSLCGQCITHCPTGALRERDDTDRVLEALADPQKITIVQIAPAVRAAWGESFGLSREFATAERLVSALRRMGINYVFDTNFSADLTIMEEGSEFLKNLPEIKKSGIPMFTSCCPGWVRFVKAQYPQYVSHLSTAKSPQQMFGAIAKSYYAELLGVDPQNIFSISIMPCVSKKHECALPIMNSAGAGQDVDVVLTTREIDRLIRAEHIIPQDLPETPFDQPLGIGTGAAVIFGTTGGVMEAALRSAYYLATGHNPDPDAFYAVRGMQGWKEAKFEIDGTKINVAIAHGLANTAKLLDALNRQEVHYDFVEIMACPGGCSGGGGQPIQEGQELAEIRGNKLRQLDTENPIRFSHENPAILQCYQDYLQKPLSHRSHELLHTNHKAWLMPREEKD